MWERKRAPQHKWFHLDAETIHNEFVDEMIKLCAFKWDCSTSDIGNHDDNDEKKKKQTGKKNIHTKKVWQKKHFIKIGWQSRERQSIWTWVYHHWLPLNSSHLCVRMPMRMHVPVIYIAHASSLQLLSPRNGTERMMCWYLINWLTISVCLSISLFLYVLLWASMKPHNFAIILMTCPKCIFNTHLYAICTVHAPIRRTRNDWVLTIIDGSQINKLKTPFFIIQNNCVIECESSLAWECLHLKITIALWTKPNWAIISKPQYQSKWASANYQWRSCWHCYIEYMYITSKPCTIAEMLTQAAWIRFRI